MMPVRSRPQTIRSILESSDSLICTQPLTSFEIQLNGLPYLPSLICDSRCLTWTKSPPEVAVAPLLVSAKLSSPEKISNSSMQPLGPLVPLIVNRTKRALTGGNDSMFLMALTGSPLMVFDPYGSRSFSVCAISALIFACSAIHCGDAVMGPTPWLTPEKTA